MSAVRRVLAALAAVLLSVIAAVALAGPASAHDVLTGSDPADGSTPATAPTAVTLTFDAAVQNYQPVLAVTGPDGSVFSTGSPTVSGSTVRVDLIGAGPAGAYRIVYRIVSADGHPVSGELTYTLAAAAAGTAVGSPAPAAGAAAPSDTGGSGSSAWLWIGVGLAAVLLIIAVVLILRRPDTSED